MWSTEDAIRCQESELITRTRSYVSKRRRWQRRCWCRVSDRWRFCRESRTFRWCGESDWSGRGKVRHILCWCRSMINVFCWRLVCFGSSRCGIRHRLCHHLWNTKHRKYYPVTYIVSLQLGSWHPLLTLLRLSSFYNGIQYIFVYDAQRDCAAMSMLHFHTLYTVI